MLPLLKECKNMSRSILKKRQEDFQNSKSMLFTVCWIKCQKKSTNQNGKYNKKKYKPNAYKFWRKKEFIRLRDQNQNIFQHFRAKKELAIITTFFIRKNLIHSQWKWDIKKEYQQSYVFKGDQKHKTSEKKPKTFKKCYQRLLSVITATTTIEVIVLGWLIYQKCRGTITSRRPALWKKEIK